MIASILGIFLTPVLKCYMMMRLPFCVLFFGGIGFYEIRLCMVLRIKTWLTWAKDYLAEVSNCKVGSGGRIMVIHQDVVRWKPL